jgi:uncharacterized protein (TIGR03067 family)
MTRRSLVGSVVLLAAAAVATAQDAKPGPTPPPGGYTLAQLGETLKKLGYEPEAIGNAKDSFRIAITRNDRKITYTLWIDSVNAAVIWCDTVLARFSDKCQPNAEALRRLLEENDRIGPSVFNYDKADRSLFLSGPIPNQDLTPAALRKAIDACDETARKAEPLWRFCNLVRLSTVPADVAGPAIAALQGEWTAVELVNLGTTVPKEQLAQLSIRFDGDRMYASNGQMKITTTVVVDPRRQPAAIDMITAEGAIELAIYQLDGDTLTIVFRPNHKPRATGFEIKPGEQMSKMVLKRKA